MNDNDYKIDLVVLILAIIAFIIMVNVLAALSDLFTF